MTLFVFHVLDPDLRTFKSSLDLYIFILIPVFFFFDLLSYGSESRQRYTLRLSVMCQGGKGFKIYSAWWWQMNSLGEEFAWQA